MAAQVTKAGHIWAWGRNHSGSLGDGTTSNRGIPTQVNGLAEAVRISAGSGSLSLALKADGTVWAWGSNDMGQIGDGTTTDRLTPVQIGGLSEVVHISAGSQHNLALKADGTVWAWGSNVMGQIGSETAIGDDAVYSPVEITDLHDVLHKVVHISAGSQHNLALKADGTVWAWGSNNQGQLGNGYTEVSTSYLPIRPYPVSDLSEVVSISAGSQHNLALKADGTVWAWARNVDGQIGDGTTTDRLTPVQVSGLSEVVDISAGYEYNLALRRDGTVWAWGSNSKGQLGDGTTTHRLTPVQVSGLSGVVNISAGTWHGLALRSDGTAWAWGSNEEGRIGRDTVVLGLDDVYSPIQINEFSVAEDVGFGIYREVRRLPEVANISAGSGHSLAIGSLR